MRRFQRAASGRTASLRLSLLSLIVCAVLAPPAAAAPSYAAMVVDGHTGRVLYSRNADSRRYPASLTKIMTLYMLFDCLKQGKCTYKTRLVVTAHAASRPPTKLGLKPGQTIRVIDVIQALVTKSANDAAAVVADNLGGSETNFARLMTARARELGMTRTVFRNASGLPHSGQVTTARDMITLARRIMQDHPEYYKFFRTKTYTYRGRTYRNHNRLLFTYKGTDGIKTGYTRASGFNLTSSVRRRNKHLVAVVMGGKTARSRNAHMQTILNRAFPKAVARLQRKRVPGLPKSSVQVASRPQAPLTTAATPIPARKPAQPRRTLVMHPLPEPSIKVAEKTRAPAPSKDKAFHVQVGAYLSADDAVARLREVSSKAKDVLVGYQALALPFLRKPKQYLYRARFAVFDQRTARATCATLKRRAINCVIMRAE
ncbi:MAG: serine hydrolase [Methyloligellaceae bacterium]